MTATQTLSDAAAAQVETLRWRDGTLEMIDQRLLPLRFEYRVCRTASEVADAIRTMVVRGAPAIGVAAGYGVALDVIHAASGARAGQVAAFDRAFDELSASRPTAVNLAWALNRQRQLLLRLREREDTDLGAALLQQAHAEAIDATGRVYDALLTRVEWMTV